MTNMQILRIKANHYKNCSNGLHIDFVPTARKTEEDKTYELNQINDSLFVFSTTAIVGKNASGKTSLLKLIENVYRILGSFQLEDELMSISGTQLEITFYHENRLFRYETELVRQNNLGKNLSFTQERIFVSDYFKSKSKLIFSPEIYTELKLKRELPDNISILFYILKERKNYAYYYDDLKDQDDMLHAAYDFYKNHGINKKYWKHILHLFDDNIMDLEEINSELFRLTYLDRSMDFSAKELLTMLSSGTIKGIALYTAAIQALQEGSGFIIDEIENHFHKTLVENLISMFKDKAVNKKGAVLIFSTHYCELLDLFGRNDNIWISKSEKQIILTNMYRDYSVRNDLLKSRKFYDDNFGTAVSYEMLMNLKRALMNE